MLPFSILLLLGTCPAFIHADEVDDWLSLPSARPLTFPPWSGSSFPARASSDHLFKHLLSPRPFPLFPTVRPFSPFPTVRPFSSFRTVMTFPPFPTVRPLFASKNTQLSTIWEDLLKTPKQDQDWPSKLMLDQDSSTLQQGQNGVTTTEPDLDQDFSHELSFHLHGDPFTAVVDHVSTFHDDIIDHVSPLLSFFNKFLDSAIGLDEAASDTENQDPNVEESSIHINSDLDGGLEETLNNDDKEEDNDDKEEDYDDKEEDYDDKEEDYEAIVLDPAVVEHTGLPQINLDENLDNSLPVIDIEILDPNVEKHIGLPDSIRNEDAHEDYEAQVADPAVIEHGDLPQFNIDENLDNDLNIMDIDEVVPNMEDENSETLASGVTEHTGMTELMQLLDNVQDSEENARNDSPQINDSAQQTQPGSGLKEEFDESSNTTTEGYNIEPIIHLIP